MPSTPQQAYITKWVGCDDKFPGLMSDPLPNHEIPQLYIDTIPRKDGACEAIYLTLDKSCPDDENRVTTIVPHDPPYKALKWATLQPPYYPALVGWSSVSLFKQPCASLSAIREFYLARIDWCPILQTTNNEDFDTTNCTDIRVGLTDKDAGEVGRKLHLRDSFVDLTVKYGKTSHTFSKEETQEPHKAEVRYCVPPGATVHLYQRRYTFAYRVWFDLKASNCELSIGPDGAPRQRFFYTSIKSEEILISEVALLNKVVGVTVETANPPPNLSQKMVDVNAISDIVDSISPRSAPVCK